MSDCKVYVTYKNLEFVLTVEEFDYQPAERATYNYPGCAAYVEATAGYVELDGDVFEPTEEELAIIAQVESDNATLFDAIYSANSEKVDAALLQHIADGKEEAACARAEYLYEESRCM